MASKIKIHNIDWWLVSAYLMLVFFGWLNIYSSVCGGEGYVFDLQQKYGVHLIWIAFSFVIAIAILFFIPSKTYSVLAYLFYAFMLILLIAVIFLGVEVNGSHSWFRIGGFGIQPAEFSKITTSCAVAALLSKYEFFLSNKRNFALACAMIVIPMAIIVLEKETGSALVYLGFAIMLYREGMSGWIIAIGIYFILLFIFTLIFGTFTSILIAFGLLSIIFAFFANKKARLISIGIPALLVVLLSQLPLLFNLESVQKITSLASDIWLAIITGAIALYFLFYALHKKSANLRNVALVFLMSIVIALSVDFLFHNVLKDYQQARIETLLGIREDPMGVGYNVHQSLIAIGSGGFAGKGYLQGTQTRFDFVPEQSTDFIFCTIGEEWGFLGTSAVMLIYLFIIIRIFNIAEKQRDKFNRIYGYCIAGCFFMHLIINVGMTLGIMPVIGIPLPLISYGGSSLVSFTAMLFIFLKLDHDNKL